MDSLIFAKVANDIASGGTVNGDLTISGDDLTMGTNTSGAVLVADGTNFNPVVISGDISIGTTGTAAIGSGVIVNADINSSAAIADSKLATISTADKVAGGAIQIDSGNDGTSITLADTDKFLVDDGGTTKYINASQLNTYTSGSIAADDISTGDAAVTLTTSSGDITIDAAANNSDIIFKGTDATSDITMLTLDGSEAGAATFNDKIVATELDISGNIDIDGTTNLDNTDIDGTFAVDGTTISLDATTSLNIDNSNTSNGITIGTATSGVPISIGHTTSETTINDNATVTGNLSVGGNFDVTGTIDLSDSDFTNAGDIQLDSITGDGDTNTSITFSGSDVITITTGGETQVTFNNGSILPTTDDDIDLGSSSYQFKDGYFDGTLEADAITVGGTAVATSGANTNISSIYNTSLAIGYGASHANIDFGTDNAIIFDIDGTQQVKVTDGAILPITDDDVDLGSASYQFKNAYFDGTLEADAITIGGTAVTAGGASAGFALAMAVAL